MKTTLEIDERVMKRLKEKAAREGRTMSELVEGALRQMLDQREPASGHKLPKLPRFAGGRILVDVANRGALLDALEED